MGLVSSNLMYLVLHSVLFLSILHMHVKKPFGPKSEASWLFVSFPFFGRKRNIIKAKQQK